MTKDGLLAQPRPLTEEESTLVRWLLDNGDPEYRQHSDQIPDLTVIWKCKCGCPTVNFALRGMRSAHIGGSPIADVLGRVEGQDVGVMLFAFEGKLTSLEVYSCAGTDKPFGLPRIETLKPY